MMIIGLTGGIGSGKSTVASEFSTYGIPVYIADDASKRLLATSTLVQQQVIDLLGAGAFVTTATGLEPDRAFIASKVFQNIELLTGLNSILHPAVHEDFNRWLQVQNAPYIIYEAAILLESNGGALCDFIILVTAPESLRIERVMRRDHVSENEVAMRMKNQWSDAQRLPYADFVIINNDLATTKVQTRRIHEIMLKNNT